MMVLRSFRLVASLVGSMFSGMALAQLPITDAAILAGSFTPGDAPGYPLTISSSGSYRLTENLKVPIAGKNGIVAIEIVAEDVTLDLNGFVVSGRATCGLIDGGNTCAANPTGIPLVHITGTNVTVKNGTIRSSEGDGIKAETSPTPTSYGSPGNSYENLTVRANRNSGIYSGHENDKFLNVRADVNGLVGIKTWGGTRMDGVSVYQNNSHGLEVTNGHLTNIVARFSEGDNIKLGSGSISGVASAGSNGYELSGGTLVVNDGYFAGHVQVGSGVILNSTVAGGAAYLTSSVCYRNVHSTLGVISGTPLTGSVAACP